MLRLASALAALVEDITDEEELAMERREFEQAIRTVAESRSADALLVFVRRWRWRVPRSVDSPHTNWQFTNSAPPRSQQATTVGHEFEPRLTNAGNALASRLGIDAQPELMKVLHATVHCVSMLWSGSHNFDARGIEQSLVSACTKYAQLLQQDENTDISDDDTITPTTTYVPEKPVQWAYVNGNLVVWHPLRD